MSDNNSPIKLAIMVRMFPNIVQTYVLSHIISMKNFGLITSIVAVKNPNQNEIHPDVYKHNLIDETIYINTSDSIFKQFSNTPFISASFIVSTLKIIFSDIWIQHGFKYGLKALMRAKVLARNSFDIIHSHSLFSTYDYLFLKEIFSIPIVTTFHGLVPKNVDMLENDKIRRSAIITDAFLVNTRFSRDQLVGLGCPKDKIHIIPQGTNTTDFVFKERTISTNNPVNILSVGRLSIEKGFHVAIAAIAKLTDEHPGIKYNIIGSGPENDHLTKLINDFSLNDIIHIHGSVSTEELLSFYRDAHIFILPSIDFRDGSHTETQGVVLQEAQSSGIPVIASRTGGIPEVIHDGVTGLLFDEENASQLSVLIKELINDSELYQRISLQGRKDVEDNYSNDVIYARVMSLYKKIISLKNN